jgi:hypothetical protein
LTRRSLPRESPQVAGLASLCRGLRSGGAVADLLTAEREAWPRFHLLERE